MAEPWWWSFARILIVELMSQKSLKWFNKSNIQKIVMPKNSGTSNSGGPNSEIRHACWCPLLQTSPPPAWAGFICLGWAFGQEKERWIHPQCMFSDLLLKKLFKHCLISWLWFCLLARCSLQKWQGNKKLFLATKIMEKRGWPKIQIKKIPQEAKNYTCL